MDSFLNILPPQKKPTIRGCNCTDAAGNQIGYAEILTMMDDEVRTADERGFPPPHRLWNGSSSTPYLMYGGRAGDDYQASCLINRNAR